jgi:hypothetical protein
MIGFLQGPQGENSSSRMLAAIVICVVSAVWAVGSIKAGSPQEIPYSVISFVAAVIAGKTVNSIFAEQRQKGESHG